MFVVGLFVTLLLYGFWFICCFPVCLILLVGGLRVLLYDLGFVFTCGLILGFAYLLIVVIGCLCWVCCVCVFLLGLGVLICLMRFVVLDWLIYLVLDLFG